MWVEGAIRFAGAARMITVKRLTLEDARIMLEAAEAKAKEIGVSRDRSASATTAATPSRSTG